VSRDTSTSTTHTTTTRPPSCDRHAASASLPPATTSASEPPPPIRHAAANAAVPPPPRSRRRRRRSRRSRHPKRESRAQETHREGPCVLRSGGGRRRTGAHSWAAGRALAAARSPRCSRMRSPCKPTAELTKGSAAASAAAAHDPGRGEPQRWWPPPRRLARGPARTQRNHAGPRPIRTAHVVDRWAPWSLHAQIGGTP
jgi:hypothetical protein